MLAAVVAVAGCSENAILELTVELPAQPVPTGRRYALVQPRVHPDNPFPDEWRGEDLPAVELGLEPVVDHVSVVSDRGDVDLGVKIRFCLEPSCTALGEADGGPGDADAPELWYLLEHPFYPGHRTFYEITGIGGIPTGRPAAPTVVGRCDIRGCVEGEITDYCRMGDGRHLCEG